jgi:hypothetical protein
MACRADIVPCCRIRFYELFGKFGRRTSLGWTGKSITYLFSLSDPILSFTSQAGPHRISLGKMDLSSLKHLVIDILGGKVQAAGRRRQGCSSRGSGLFTEPFAERGTRGFGHATSRFARH